jgi:tetratricopeptide (TPR) repeat protein
VSAQRLVASILFCLVGLALVMSRFWDIYSRPFDPEEFVRYAVKHHLLVEPDEAIRKTAIERSITVNDVNTQSSAFKQLNRRAYLVDAERMLKLWLIPHSWKVFLREQLFASGVTWPCRQILLVDGSIARRDPRSFAGRMSGLPEKYLKELPKEYSREFLLFTFLHESVHLTELHYEVAGLDSLLQAGLERLKSNDLSGAKISFSKSIGVCPAYIEGIDQLAITERRLGQVTEALKLYEQSLHVKPSGDVAHKNIVWILMNLHNVKVARIRADEVKRLLPNDPEGFFSESVADYADGDLIAARTDSYIARSLYLKTSSPLTLEADLIQLGIAYLRSNGEEIQKATLLFRADCNRFAGQRKDETCSATDKYLANNALSFLRMAASL